MKWKKLGKIFDPANYALPNNCVEFAQSPQTLEFDDFIRIYFSTRQKEETTQKYLSHIAYVDMDKEFKNVKDVSSTTVIELGSLGTFDEHGIFPINIVRNKEKIIAYTCGWSRRVAVSVETAVGMAFSEDGGKTFNKLGVGPILSASLHEPFLVGDAFVRFYENKWHMWYIYGTRWMETKEEETARIYKIGHAVSADGITWEREGKQIIADKLNADECQALPSVIRYHNRYHMFFCYRQATGFRTGKERSYRIGYAVSDDLQNWERQDHNAGIDVSDSGWDAEMMCYPHVFECNGKLYLLYNGNEFGRSGFGLAVAEE